MAEDEWVDVSSAPLLADERWLHAVSSNGTAEPSPDAPRLRIVTLEEFVAVEEVTAEPLLGSKTETILPADGMLLMYGDGGAGKTTLSLDGVFHLCSGRSWLGLEVQRCLKVLVIENEGPRGKFRQMLGEKQAAWDVPLGDQLVVLEEPWTQFTLQADAHRQALAEYVGAFAVDVVVMGPLVTLGMIGGGTPDEVSAFESLIADTRQRCEKAFALWVVHHENKAGDVSGAWERVPDTLIHIQAQGNGHTRLVWRKARWSSEHHGKSLELVWGDGRSFETVEKKVRDPWEEMAVAFTRANGWRTVKEAARLIAISEADAKKVLAELVRRGEFEYEQGPPGRHGSAHCYRLKGALVDSAHLDAPSENLADEEQGARLRSPVRGAAARSAPAPSSEAASKEVSAPSAPSPEDDGIPF